MTVSATLSFVALWLLWWLFVVETVVVAFALAGYSVKFCLYSSQCHDNEQRASERDCKNKHKNDMVQETLFFLPLLRLGTVGFAFSGAVVLASVLSG